jgi:DNA-binding IclR family transcriptional regulator
MNQHRTSGRRTLAASKDRLFVTALARGLDVLRCFTPSTPELSASEIAKKLGLPQPTVWRLCHTLSERGFLTRPSAQGKFGLGIPVLAIGYSLLAGRKIGDLAQPFMQQVANEYQGAVSLGTRLDETGIILLQRCQGSSVILSDLRVGTRIPVAFSASGWAYIAAQSPEERERLFSIFGREEEKKRWKEAEPQLRRAIKEYAERGYIINLGVLHRQIHAVAVPVISSDKQQVLTLSAGGLDSIFVQHRLHQIGKKLKVLADEIARILPASSIV